MSLCGLPHISRMRMSLPVWRDGSFSDGTHSRAVFAPSFGPKLVVVGEIGPKFG